MQDIFQCIFFLNTFYGCKYHPNIFISNFYHPVFSTKLKNFIKYVCQLIFNETDFIYRSENNISNQNICIDALGIDVLWLFKQFKHFKVLKLFVDQ